MNVVLLSTYELGRQPFGLASPAAWLRQAGAQVTCCDLAINALEAEVIHDADLVAFYLPMHTATRIAAPLIERVRRWNPRAHLCCYGLYAPLNEAFLRKLGVQTILGGEFETGLVTLAKQLQAAETTVIDRKPTINLRRQQFQIPDRHDLPALQRYAFLDLGDGAQRTVGYTEATRGCKHRCRHCPIVPVYDGQFRIIQREVVLADIRNQVAAGAQHITFGDPDFFNGPGHALPIVQALHAEFPDLTYDVTIKVEHLLQQAEALPILRDTGCLFVTSAVEAVDDQILRLLDKGHTRADFIAAAQCCQQIGLTLNPTFVAFNPWITITGYGDLLAVISELGLVEHVPPIQYAIRLLITASSRLLELPSIQALIHPFDEAALVYPWQHPDPRVDQLQQDVIALVHRAEKAGQSRSAIFANIWQLAQEAQSASGGLRLTEPPTHHQRHSAYAPRLSEPWYC
ncbi:MAG: radical SAM protein [Caldilinea sp. CFX5]|nr:radical SAM protein [Caldilinea sp. CFX5]